MPASPAVAAAAQASADRFAQIDEQVATALGVSVDASLLPSLATHLTTLHTTLAQWVDPVRPSATRALRAAFTLDEATVATWPVDRADPAALAAFAAALRQGVGSSQAAVGQVGQIVAPLRAGVDGCLAALGTDAQAVSAQLAGDQDVLDQLEEEIEDDQEAIEEYHEDPFRYLLQGGVDISGIMGQLTTLITSDTDQQAAVDRAQGVLTAISQLTDAGGALNSLSSTLGGLSTSLVDTQTAVAQVGNTLASIVDEPPLPPILAAQLESMVTDLKAADSILTSLAGTA